MMVICFIRIPAEVEKLIDEQSGIGLASRNIDTFVRYQFARAIRDAAKQPGGLFVIVTSACFFKFFVIKASTYSFIIRVAFA